MITAKYESSIPSGTMTRPADRMTAKTATNPQAAIRPTLAACLACFIRLIFLATSFLIDLRWCNTNEYLSWICLKSCWLGLENGLPTRKNESSSDIANLNFSRE